MRLGFLVAGVVLAVAQRAAADDPVVVEYIAPPECASSDAFHALLAVQIARMPNPDRTWRFSVRVTHVDDAYLGRVQTETGARELHGKTCDEVVSALVLVIAMATPLTQPKDQTPPPPATTTATPATTPSTTDDIETLPPLEYPTRRSRDRVRPDHAPDSSTSIRLALGAQDYSTLTAGFSAAGPALTASIEPRWGWYRMMFELGYGLQFMGVSNGLTSIDQTASFTITWNMIDFEACPIDVALGDSNINVIACNSLVIGSAIYPANTIATAGALFFGGEGRIRWQSPAKLFVEGHVGALISTQSGEWASSDGLWVNVGAQIGIAL